MSLKINIIKSHTFFPLFEFPNLKQRPYWFYEATFSTHGLFLVLSLPTGCWSSSDFYLTVWELFSLELLLWLPLNECPQASWANVQTSFPRKKSGLIQRWLQKLAKNGIFPGEKSTDRFSLSKEQRNQRCIHSEL